MSPFGGVQFNIKVEAVLYGHAHASHDFWKVNMNNYWEAPELTISTHYPIEYNPAPPKPGTIYIMTDELFEGD
jgi:hypothetical protein